MRLLPQSPPAAFRVGAAAIRIGAALFCGAAAVWAAAGGSISGTLTDPSGAVVAGARLTLVNAARRTTYRTVSNARGFYSFPMLAVGRYDLTIAADGLKTRRRTALTVDADAALRVDATLELGRRSETVTVTAQPARTAVDTVATHLGEVVSGRQMTALPLNGRSYTDLLAIQPGVISETTLLPDSVIMAGVTGTLSPSGDLNPGNVSIDGRRESSNGFMVNGIDVREPMNGGTSIVPNLDAIEEFRVLTNNFDPEYGNYNGGMVNVVTRSGSNRLHGNAFEFLRNTALDARGYFDPARPAFRQNQFGATLGGPLRRNQLFLFADYQGTRTAEGVETGRISVPSQADRSGDLFDQAASLTGRVLFQGGQVVVPSTVSGPYLAAAVLAPRLGYPVSQGEPYYFSAGERQAGNPALTYSADCVSPAQCVFPHAILPPAVWSSPATKLLGYIPTPNSGADQFSSSAFAQTVRDDKGGTRMDADSRWGNLSAYYFVDDYRLDNPYPGQQGGASIPGFDALTYGRAQLIAGGDTKALAANTVNEFHAAYLRNANVIGRPRGGLGLSLAAQGFVSGPGTDGIVVQAPRFEGVENIAFPTFTMGVPITNETQINNTFYLSDTFSMALARHTLKFGAQSHIDRVNERPNATFNGTFNIDGTETGSPFADFLIGVPSNYTQSSGQPFYLRNRYLGLFAQDSWRAESRLTVNMGMRWDGIMPWWEKYNQIQTVVAGRNSTVYPGAPPGLVFPGDPGIPRTLSPSRYDNFAPRMGIAYAPKFDRGFGKALFGGDGRSGIRAGYGIYYTAFPGLTAGVMYSDPPYGFNYLSPAPPLFATPFVSAANGADNGQRFPFPFPPHGVSAQHPDANVNWSNFVPLAADPYFYYRNRVPYIDNYMLSLQRQIAGSALLTVSYAGNQGHRILMLLPTNPGNPALCLSLSRSDAVAPGTPTCGPFGEDALYTATDGRTYRGTRVGLGPDYGADTAQTSIGNSTYNALQANLRYSGKGAQFLLGYTYGKSIDQGSNLGEQLNPLNPRLTRAISAYDLRHDVVASYTLALPFADLFRRSDRWAEGWSLSGDTRFSTGFPVTLLDDSDNSLLGTLGDGVNNLLLDTPETRPGPLRINTNGRNGRPAFNLSLFSEEALGRLGNARRRYFYGPGIENFDMTLDKMLPLAGSRSVELRVEAFNAFNHTQFFGPAAVDGQIEDPHFGQIVSAAPPRLVQLAVKFAF